MVADLTEHPSPWTETNFVSPYKGLHNDLESLLRARYVDGNPITVFLYTLGARIFLQNCIYSFVNYGKGHNYIVFAIGATSLQSCIQMKLPCYNATHMVRSAINDSHHADFFTPDFINIGWVKIMAADAVFGFGYDVHVSDIDMVYMRHVSSLADFAARVHADGTLLTEESMPEPAGAEQSGYINIVNIGSIYFKSNFRTKNLVRSWLFRAFEASDQVVFNGMAYQQWGLCDSPASCKALRKSGKAAIIRHPSLWKEGSCVRESIDPCDTRALYVHILCVVGKEKKLEALRKLDLLFIKDEASGAINESAGRQLSRCPPGRETAWKVD